ncbi:MAG TPA: hypothetical protein VM074_03335 [Solimonas sp.]|nr:hypothetical protein [Solimonas sp.]
MQALAVRAMTGVALLLAAGAAMAQEEQRDMPQDCRIHEQGQWQTLGTGSVTSCLKGIDRWVADYNPQGFKFGFWAQLMLAADRNYFYHSADGGKTWVAIGLKAQDDVRRLTDQAPDLPGPRIATGGAPARVDALKAMSMSFNPLDRKTCSVFANNAWENIADLNLEQCASELGRAFSGFDANGFKYGYWSGQFLAANRDEVFHSDDGTSWRPIAGVLHPQQ